MLYAYKYLFSSACRNCANEVVDTWGKPSARERREVNERILPGGPAEKRLCAAFAPSPASERK